MVIATAVVIMSVTIIVIIACYKSTVTSMEDSTSYIKKNEEKL